MDLREVIESAFAAVPYPGDDCIIAGSSEEGDELKTYFLRRSWRGHSAQQLRYHDSALGLFTEDALLYFLPAFLIASIEDPETADTIPSRILGIFTAPGNYKPQSHEAFDRFIKRFTTQQRDALLQVFERIYSDDDVAALKEVFRSHAVHAA